MSYFEWWIIPKLDRAYWIGPILKEILDFVWKPKDHFEAIKT